MHILHIKNMVCDRCKKVIREELQAIGVEVYSIELGTIHIEQLTVDLDVIGKVLRENGFELIANPEEQLVERIKVYLISLMDQLPLNRKEKMSVMISNRLEKDYSTVSKVFSRHESITIEKYFLRLKLEKVKELIQDGAHSFSQISNLLDYSSLNHLSSQFKQETGMSMTAYKGMFQSDRKPLDKIV